MVTVLIRFILVKHAFRMLNSELTIDVLAIVINGVATRILTSILVDKPTYIPSTARNEFALFNKVIRSEDLIDIR